MSKRDHIVSAVKDALKINIRVYDRDQRLPSAVLMPKECSAAVLKNVCSRIAPGCAPEDILLILDVSGGMGTGGMVFTENGLYASRDIMKTSGMFAKPFPQPSRYEDFVKEDKNAKGYYKEFILEAFDGRRYIMAHSPYIAFLCELRKRIKWALMNVAEENKVREKEALRESAGQILSRGEALAAKGDISGMVSCLAKAADTGDAESLYRYGRLFEEGRGVQQDMNTAFKLYSAAADKKHPKAQVAVGEMLIEGRGTKCDPLRGKDYYRSAAFNGDAEGQYRLGLLTLEEKGFEDLGLSYLQKAADQGHEAAGHALIKITASRDVEYSNAVSCYKKGDYQGAAERLLPLARRGMAKAQYWYGHLCLQGMGVPENHQMAFNFFKKAADSEFAPAMVSCAYCYITGTGVEEDRGAANDMLQRAAKLGDQTAIERLKEGHIFDLNIVYY